MKRLVPTGAGHPGLPIRKNKGARALALLGLCTVLATACEPHSHDAQAPHTHPTSELQSSPDKRDKADLSGFSPFLVQGTVVDGTALGEDTLVLVTDMQTSSPSRAHRPDMGMVLFLQRQGRIAKGDASWTNAVTGGFTREVAYDFASTTHRLKSRGGASDEGFEAEGTLSLEDSGRFTSTITREVEQRLRIHRTTTGATTDELLTGISNLDTYRWDLRSWSLTQQQRFLLLTGIPDPGEKTASVHGEWRSVTLEGPIRRTHWQLDGGTYQARPGGRPKAALMTGEYTLGPGGSITLSQGGAAPVSRRGTVNSGSSSGVVFLERADGRYSSASLWWQHQAEPKAFDTAGTWTVHGRTSSTNKEADGSGLYTGEVTITSDGTMAGNIRSIGASQPLGLSGKLSLTPFGGELNLEIPLSLASPSKAPTSPTKHEH